MLEPLCRSALPPVPVPFIIVHGFITVLGIALRPITLLGSVRPSPGAYFSGGLGPGQERCLLLTPVSTSRGGLVQTGAVRREPVRKDEPGVEVGDHARGDDLALGSRRRFRRGRLLAL